MGAGDGSFGEGGGAGLGDGSLVSSIGGSLIGDIDLSGDGVGGLGVSICGD